MKTCDEYLTRQYISTLDHIAPVMAVICDFAYEYNVPEKWNAFCDPRQNLKNVGYGIW